MEFLMIILALKNKSWGVIYLIDNLPFFFFFPYSLVLWESQNIFYALD